MINMILTSILYVGSTRVGKIVLKAAAENLTPVSLELGEWSQNGDDDVVDDDDDDDGEWS
jgi:acyl-CoA reductase-like NAD-dependent aldehyde dehydrogenase